MNVRNVLDEMFCIIFRIGLPLGFFHLTSKCPLSLYKLAFPINSLHKSHLLTFSLSCPSPLLS